MNEKTATKYLKLCATVELILLAFPNLYIVEARFSHAHYLLRKQKSTLNIGRGDLRLKPQSCTLIFAISSVSTKNPFIP